MISVYDSILECCGCEACAQICPKQCISMVEDEKGFFYPSIDQANCIDCGLCKKSCLYITPFKKQGSDNCYAFLNNDESVRLQSASSGAFEAVCKAFTLNTKGSNFVIFGCELTEDLLACHSESLGFSNFSKFKKSKYIQSRINTVFIKVRNYLKAGELVIFSGTPCQVQGLKLFLKKDYPNLLLIDILCHGVPSQKVFSKYIESLERKHKSKVIEYQFRYKVKDTSDVWSNHNVLIRFENGLSKVYNCSEDMYMSSFLAGLFNREACMNCLFASTERVSDVTLGDFWGIGDAIPTLSELKTNGTSLILVNTDKGRSLINRIREFGSLYELSLQAAIPYNEQLSRPQSSNEKRSIFFKYLNRHNGFMKAMRACFPQRYGWKIKLQRELYANNLYQKLSKLKKRIRYGKDYQ